MVDLGPMTEILFGFRWKTKKAVAGGFRTSGNRRSEGKNALLVGFNGKPNSDLRRTVTRFGFDIPLLLKGKPNSDGVTAIGKTSVFGTWTTSSLEI